MITNCLTTKADAYIFAKFNCFPDVRTKSPTKNNYMKFVCRESGVVEAPKIMLLRKIVSIRIVLIFSSILLTHLFVGIASVSFAQSTAAPVQAVDVVPSVGPADGDDPSFRNLAKFSADGVFIATISATNVKIWHRPTGRLLRILQSEYFIRNLLIRGDGKIVATVHNNGEFRLWNTLTGKTEYTRNADNLGLLALAFSENEQFIAFGGRSGVVEVFDTIKRQIIFSKIVTKDPEHNILQVKFLGNSTIDFITSGKRFRVDLNKNIISILGKLPQGYEYRADALIDERYSIIESRQDDCDEPSIYVRYEGKNNFTAKIKKPIACKVDFNKTSGSNYMVYEKYDNKLCVIADAGEKSLCWVLDISGPTRTADEVRFPGYLIGVSPDHKSGMFRVGTALRLYRMATGGYEGELKNFGSAVASVVSSADSSIFAGMLDADDRDIIALWRNERPDPELIKLPSGKDKNLTVAGVSSNGSNLLLNLNDEKMAFFDVGANKITEIYGSNSNSNSQILTAALAANGESAAIAVKDDSKGLQLKLVATINGQIKTNLDKLIFNKEENSTESVKFSADGSLVAMGLWTGGAIIWNTSSGKIIFNIKEKLPKEEDIIVSTVSFSADNSLVALGHRSGYITVWDLYKKTQIASFGNPTVSSYPLVRTIDISSDKKMLAIGISRRSSSSGDYGSDDAVFLWDLSKRELIKRFDGHESGVEAVNFLNHDALIRSISLDGTVRYWRISDGRQISISVVAHLGEWMTVTFAGFFTGSAHAGELIEVVRGYEPYSVTQFKDHLYRPDLVSDLLAGDENGKYVDAASKLNLETVLSSGPAPQIEVLDQARNLDQNTVSIRIKLTDMGGGIGAKLVWRVNGVTQGSNNVENQFGGHSDKGFIIQERTLSIGQNSRVTIEVAAYNQSGLLASDRKTIEIEAGKILSARRPDMYIVAVGIDRYKMDTLQLKNSANDARSVGETLQAGGSGIYGNVFVEYVLDKDATTSGIETAIDKVAFRSRFDDVFVLYVAGHGRTIDGNYYFIPQDMDFSAGQTVLGFGMGYETWQKLLARVTAQKSVLIFDTCESSSAAGLTRGTQERESALDRLRYATGRSIITAARQAAFEGYRGHGVLTYSILERFDSTSGKPSEGEIDILNLAMYVNERVPELSRRVYGISQRPLTKIEGNFPLATAKLNLQLDGISIVVNSHVIIKSVLLRERPAVDANGIRELAPGTQVSVGKSAGGWDALYRDGQLIGYVESLAVVKLQ